jgi:hypothetical protein
MWLSILGKQLLNSIDFLTKQLKTNAYDEQEKRLNDRNGTFK